jgi:hypothetical protein
MQTHQLNPLDVSWLLVESRDTPILASGVDGAVRRDGVAHAARLRLDARHCVNPPARAKPKYFVF